jgi:hypothetical protein
MIIYLLWGLIFGGLFHMAMIQTNQEVVFTEVLFVVLGWPFFFVMFILMIIQELRK